MPQFLNPKTESEWLGYRKFDVTSTESAALFGLSPYTTAFELYHNKKSGEVQYFAGNERTKWGQVLERTIADRVAETYGVKIRRLSAYVRRDDGINMGASFDFEIVGVVAGQVESTVLQDMYNQHGTGVLEIKNVDWIIFRDQWQTEEPARAPDHIEVQVQHQLECVQRDWTALAALVGGNRLFVIPRLRDREIGAAILGKIKQFWQDVADDKVPPLTLPEDAEFVSKLCGYAEPGKVLDAQADDRIKTLCAAYAAANDVAKKAQDDKDSAKAELLLAIGDAEKVLVDGFTISAGMVGPAQVSYERKGYRNFKLTPKKVKS